MSVRVASVLLDEGGAVGGSATGEGMAAWLRALPQDELAALLDRRSDLLSRPPASIEDLASRLAEPRAVQSALELVDGTAVQVGAVLSLLDGRATVTQLVAALGRTEPVEVEEVERALGALAVAGLAWPVPGGVWRSATGLRHHAEALLGVGPPWREVVQLLAPGEVCEVLQLLGVDPPPSTYDAVLALQHLGERPSALRRVVEAAPEEARRLLEHLAGAGDGSALEGTPTEDWLGERMLLVVDRDDARALPREVAAVVRGERLLGALRRPPADPTAPQAPPAAAADRALALVSDVRSLLAVCEATPIKPLRSGGVGVQEQRRLAKALDQPEERVAWLLDLAGSARLLALGGLAGAPTTAADRWRALDEPPAWVELVRAVLDDPAGPRSQVGEPPVPLHGWRFPSRELLPLPLVLEGATRHAAREEDPGLVAWLDWRHYRSVPMRRHRELLQEQLSQLALLGLRAEGSCAPWAAALRDGDDGAAVEALAAALPPVQDDAVLQADGTVVVGGRASAGLRDLLDAVAEREAERTWRISAAGVRGLLDDGRSADDLLSELRQRSRHPLPQVVEQLVRDVAAKHGRIRVIPARTLLRVDDVPLAVELLRDPRLKALGLTEVQPGVLSSPTSATEVLAALRAAGHAPVGDGLPTVRRPARKAARTTTTAPRRGPSARDVAARLQATPVRPPRQPAAPREAPAAQVIPLSRYRPDGGDAASR